MAAARKIDKFGIQIQTWQDLYKIIYNYKEKAISTAEWHELDPEDQRYVDHLVKEFQRNGMQLEGEQGRQRVRQLQMEIVEMQRLAFFNMDHDDQSQGAEVRETEFDGMSDEFVEGLEVVPGKVGYRYVSMDEAEINDVMRLCQNEETRRKVEVTVLS